MKNNKILLFLVLPVLAWMLSACANNKSIARVHPEAVSELPDCTECHSDSWGSLNHRTPDFFLKHKFYAGSGFACASCHEQSFCSDCHAHKEEIRPSAKHFEAPQRNLPHRGDYLSQHKIDGKINPASCFKCHGRQNNERCLPCHK